MAVNNTYFTKEEEEIARSLGVAAENLSDMVGMINELSSLESGIEALDKQISNLKTKIDDAATSDTEKALYTLKKEELDAQRENKKDILTKKIGLFNKTTGKDWNNAATKDDLKDAASKAEEAKMSKIFGKNGSKITKINKGIEAAAKVLDAIKDYVKLGYDLQLNQLNYIQKVNKAGLTVAGSRLTKAVSGSLTGITSGATEGSFAAAGNAIELQKEIADYGRQQRMAELQMRNYEKVRITEAITGTISAAATGIGTIIGAAAGGPIGAAIGAGIGMIVGKVGELFTTVLKGETQLSEKQLEIINEQTEQMDSTISSLAKNTLDFTKNINEFFLKSEKAATDIGIAFGYSRQQLEDYKSSAYRTQIVISKWGKTLEDLAQIQNQYAETTGRNIQMSSNEADTSFALGRFVGQDIQLNIASQMELFGKSISNSNETVFEMYQNVNRMGLSGRKFAKDLAQNLKMASKYNFKGGVEGLMKMSMWAQKTRFNMNSLSGMLDEIQGGGIEELITKSAGFQVLGGRAAMHSDPLGMMFDAWADPQAYAKRMQDMTKGFGRFNSKTGETEFNINESMQLAQIAKLQGRSVEEVRNEIIERNKRNRVEGMLNPNEKFSEMDKTAIGSKAHVDKNGEWVVTLSNGEEKRVNELNKEDIGHLMPETNDEKLVEYAMDSRDYLSQIAAVTTRGKASLVVDNEGKFKEHQTETIKEEKRFFDKTRAEINEILRTELVFIQQTQKLQHEIFVNSLEVIKKANKAIINRATDIAKQLVTADSIIREYVNILTIKDENERNKALVDFSKRRLITPQDEKTQKEIEMHSSAAEKAKQRGDVQSEVIHLAEEQRAKGEYNSAFLTNMALNQLKKTNPTMPDGVIYGSSMMVSAPNIVPIHDGIVSGVSSSENPNISIIHDGVVGGSTSISPKILPTNTNITTIHDGVANANGTSMMVSAPKIVPIHDGITQFAAADPKDTALFAKTGGPFDTLFNGIFDKINSMSDAMSSGMNLSINGKIELTGQNGQSVDIMSMLQSDPMFIRKITEMIVLQMNNNANGGRNEMFHNRFSG